MEPPKSIVSDVSANLISRLYHKRYQLVEYIGWVGVVVLLLNYALLSSGAMSGNGILYHVVSLIGTFCIWLQAWSKTHRQVAILNMIFAFVALYAIIRILVSN